MLKTPPTGFTDFFFISTFDSQKEYEYTTAFVIPSFTESTASYTEPQ